MMAKAEGQQGKQEEDREGSKEGEREGEGEGEGGDEIDAIIAITNERRATTSTADIAAWIGDQAVDSPDLPYRIRQSAATILLEERLYGRPGDAAEEDEQVFVQRQEEERRRPSSQRRATRRVTGTHRSSSAHRYKRESGDGKVKVLSTFRPAGGDKGKQRKAERKRATKDEARADAMQKQGPGSVDDTAAASAAAAAAVAVKNTQRAEGTKPKPPPPSSSSSSSSSSSAKPLPAAHQEPHTQRKKEPIYARIRKAKEDAKILKDELAKLQLELDAEEEELALLEKAEARGW